MHALLTKYTDFVNCWEVSGSDLRMNDGLDTKHKVLKSDACQSDWIRRGATATAT